jgi:hypothetical protein
VWLEKLTPPSLSFGNRGQYSTTFSDKCFTPLAESMHAGSTKELDNDVLICLCSRSFTQQSALSKHQRTCKKSKKRLTSALDKAKEAWAGRKKRKLNNGNPLLLSGPSLPGLTRAPSPVSNEVCFYQIS